MLCPGAFQSGVVNWVRNETLGNVGNSAIAVVRNYSKANLGKQHAIPRSSPVSKGFFRVSIEARL